MVKLRKSGWPVRPFPALFWSEVVVPRSATFSVRFEMEINLMEETLQIVVERFTLDSAMEKVTRLLGQRVCTCVCNGAQGIQEERAWAFAHGRHRLQFFALSAIKFCV